MTNYGDFEENNRSEKVQETFQKLRVNNAI